MIKHLIKTSSQRLSGALEAYPYVQTKLKQVYRKLPEFLRGEQIVYDNLAKYVKKNPSLFFLQVGANDGFTNDHLYSFVKKYDLEGILLEPVPIYFQRLCQVYRGKNLILENSAIAESNELREFYYFEESEDIPKWASGCGSFIRENLFAHKGEWPDFEKYLKTTQVSCLTLSSLMEKHKRNSVDLIMIDAEGYDWEVLKQVKLDEWNVSLVIFEHTLLSKEIFSKACDFLRRSNFELYSDSYDTLAKRERTSLQS